MCAYKLGISKQKQNTANDGDDYIITFDHDNRN